MERLTAALGRGASVLTANLRLARHLRAAFDRKMAGEGLRLWPTPEVLPFASWAAAFWERHGDGPVLPGAASSALWEKVLGPGGPAAGGWPAGVARASYEAYGLLKEYGLRLPEDIYLTEEARALKRWTALYDGELRRLGFIDQASVLGKVSGVIAKGAEGLPKEAVIAGFDETSPAATAVILAMKARGVDVWSWPGEGGGAAAQEVRVRAFADEAEEVVQAARWARETLRPGMRIGFIAPELERYREAVVREFASELNPGSVLPGVDGREVFNISLGRPLSDEPLVEAALGLLAMVEGDLDIESVSSVLRSPYFGGAERLALARLDLMLKEDNRVTLSLAVLKDLSKRTGNAAFERKVDAWIKWLKGARAKDLPSNWARSFTGALSRIGWLAGVRLSGREFQAHKAWNSCLETLSSLDDITGRVARAGAAAALEKIAREKVHQPETPECNIQVLGLLESTGIVFDRLWIMGCHEHALPSEPSPNPFIPVRLQKERGLPRSTSERELEFARSAVKRLLRSAPSVEVSYPLLSDRVERRVSPFFSPFQRHEGKIACSARLVDSVRGAALEDAPADEPVPVSTEEKEYIRGGTLILKDQSRCPFRAFAVHRLNAAPLPVPEPGLKPEKRGSIIHSALRLFWEKVGGSEGLKGVKDSGGLGPYIEGVAEAAVREARIPPPLSTRFLDIEKKRLVALLQSWVEVELSRGVGFKVKALEAESEIDIGGLRIRGRVDRVDELEDGGVAIIDYKSGKPDRYEWLTRRPREPQLLIYSLTGGFDAVSFARLDPGECRFVGISRGEALPGIKPYEDDREFKKKADCGDWDALMEHWRAAVAALAADFMAGLSQVDPDSGPSGSRSACRHCGLTALCRITEAGFHKDEDDEGDGDGDG